MRQNKELFWKLFTSICNQDPVQDALLQHKDLDPEKIRAVMKKEECFSVFRRLVQENRIPFAEAEQLLFEAEENGGQHIFYFVPANDEVKNNLNDRNYVGDAILGEGWEAKSQQIDYIALPDRPLIADFRSLGDIAEGPRWILKFIGREMEYHEGRELVPINGELYRRVHQDYARAVYVVRWHAWGLLEIRVPNWSKSSTEAEMARMIWDQISSFADESWFYPWDLHQARRRMIEKWEENESLYLIGDTRITDDKGGKNHFSPKRSKEHVFASTLRREALNLWVKSDKPCDSLAIMWLPQKGDDSLDGVLRTVVGSPNHPANVVIVGAQTTSKAIDHVTNKLRIFAKP